MFSKFLLFLIFILLFFNSWSQSPDFLWAKQSGGEYEDDRGMDIARDNLGNVIAVGYVTSYNVFFDTVALSNASNNYSDCFVSKYNSTGSVLWVKLLGGLKDDITTGVEVDINNNVIVSGYFESPYIIVENDTLFNNNSFGSEAFLIKYDSNGNLLWSWSSSGLGFTKCMGMCLGDNGDVFITGTISNSLIVDLDTIQTKGNMDIFNMRFDSSGNIIWYSSFGGLLDEYAKAIKFDVNNKLIIVGDFESSSLFISSDTIFYNPLQDRNMFLVQYDSVGNFEESIQTNCEYASAKSIYTDHAGNLFLSGVFAGGTDLIINNDTIYFGNGNLGFFDSFIIKFDLAKNVLWSKRFAKTIAKGVSVNNDFDVCLVGELSGGPIVFCDPIPYNSGGLLDVFIVKYDSIGNCKWSKKIGGTETDFINAVEFDLNGDLIIIGGFQGIVNFGSYVLDPIGIAVHTDIYVAKLSGVVGLYDMYLESNINIFPNPSGGKIHFISDARISEIKVVDIMGKETSLSEKEIQGNQLDLKSYLPGIYFLKFTLWNKKIVCKKIVLN